jgi:hypothetical protein
MQVINRTLTLEFQYSMSGINHTNKDQNLPFRVYET